MGAKPLVCLSFLLAVSLVTSEGCGTNFTSPKGVIQSPGYPQTYEATLHCVYLISQPVGYHITLTFTDFDLEDSLIVNCKYDYLKIQDGDSESSPILLHPTCGTKVPGPVTSTGNKMNITFHTDSVDTGRGFNATYISECEETFNSTQGVIHSPKYPAYENPNTICVYRIVQPPGYRIILVFKGFTFGNLEVRDGDSATSPLLCANNNEAVNYCTDVISTQSTVIIYFNTSGNYLGGHGFNATYETEVVPSELVLLTNPNAIDQIDIKTTTIKQLLAVNDPYDLDYDPVDARIYWIDEEFKIRNVLLNGDDERDWNMDEDSNPCDIAIDPQSRLLFYTDCNLDIISMTPLSHLYQKDIIYDRLNYPLALALDTYNGIIYWSVRGETSRIERATYNGSNQYTIVSDVFVLPTFLAIDLLYGNLFWLETTSGNIESLNINSSSRKVVINSSYLRTVYGMCLFDSHLYIIDGNPDTFRQHLLQTDTNGSSIKNLMTLNSEHFNREYHNVRIYSTVVGNRDLNGCGLNNGGCSHFCLPMPGNKSMCGCPQNYTLDQTLTTCIPGIDACTMNNGGCSYKCIVSFNQAAICTCPAGTILSSDGKTCSQECGGNYTNSTGIIMSPFYLKLSNKNADCVYLILQPDGFQITLTFNEFDLPFSYLCKFDYLKITDGDSPSSPLLNNKLLCGSSKPAPIRTTQNKMWIQFKSQNESEYYRGFKVSYNASKEPHEFMLVSTQQYSALIRIDLETGTQVYIPVSNMTSPLTVDYDPITDRIYWISSSEIGSAFLNGTEYRPIRQLATYAHGIAVDWRARLLFYTVRNGVIGMISIKDCKTECYHRTLINSTINTPYQIVLDTQRGIMYWISVGKEETIERANYDGCEQTTLVNSTQIINALAIDVKNEHLYWAEFPPYQMTLYFLDMKSGNRSKLHASSTTHEKTTIALSESFLYFYICEVTSVCNITRINNNDKSNTTILQENLISDMRVYSGHREQVLTGCGLNNGGCSHFCIPRPDNTTSCLCPDGYKSENKTFCSLEESSHTRPATFPTFSSPTTPRTSTTVTSFVSPVASRPPSPSTATMPSSTPRIRSYTRPSTEIYTDTSSPLHSSHVGSSANGVAAGSAVAVLIIIIAIVVVLLVMKKKGIVFWNRPQRLVNENMSFADLASRSYLQDYNNSASAQIKTGVDEMPESPTVAYSHSLYGITPELNPNSFGDKHNSATTAYTQPIQCNIFHFAAKDNETDA